MTTEQESYPWPYNLPIWRNSFKDSSPNGQLSAEIAPAYESSMGNPTLGLLRVSDGLQIKSCNPSFIWSANSRFLAVPQSSRILGFFFAVRILIIDTRDRRIYATKRFRGWLQPESFANDCLVVIVHPFGSARKVQWSLPQDLNLFKCFTYEEVKHVT